MMKPRMQSPSSINVYQQCPRRYFYQYILKLPTKPSIHLIRGSIVHEILEHFFALDINAFDKEDLEFGLRSYVTSSLLKLWKKNESKLRALGLTRDELDHYLVDSQEMLTNFTKDFVRKMREQMAQSKSLEEAFGYLTPKVEEEIRNEQLNVRGFIDAIHETDEGITILDYKTSKKDEITPAYRLQLGIYALVYLEKYGKRPDHVGINFLKFGERIIPVHQDLIDEAKQTIEEVHDKTSSRNIKDYPVNITPLCKWSTGQCDFYDICIKQRDL